MSGNALLFILFFIGCIGFGVLWEVFRRRCPQCKRFFARTIVRGNVSYDVNYRRDHLNKTTVSQCQCKFCGHQWTQTYTSTKHRR